VRRRIDGHAGNRRHQIVDHHQLAAGQSLSNDGQPVLPKGDFDSPHSEPVFAVEDIDIALMDRRGRHDRHARQWAAGEFDLDIHVSHQRRALRRRGVPVRFVDRHDDLHRADPRIESAFYAGDAPRPLATAACQQTHTRIDGSKVDPFGQQVCIAADGERADEAPERLDADLGGNFGDGDPVARQQLVSRGDVLVEVDIDVQDSHVDRRGDAGIGEVAPGALEAGFGLLDLGFRGGCAGSAGPQAGCPAPAPPCGH
jgi:hypothetical protein